MRDLFESEEGFRRKEAGMALADEHAGQAIKLTMEMCLREVCAKNWFFTADDVYDLARSKGTETPWNPRWFGSVLKRAARDGMIIKADCRARPSNRASLHAHALTVWESLIYGRE